MYLKSTFFVEFISNWNIFIDFLIFRSHQSLRLNQWRKRNLNWIFPACCRNQLVSFHFLEMETGEISVSYWRKEYFLTNFFFQCPKREKWNSLPKGINVFGLFCDSCTFGFQALFDTLPLFFLLLQSLNIFFFAQH